MAKSKSFFGLRKGSTKSMTFSTLNGQQVTKDRVSEVRNPKTSGQAVQRMKLAPAQKFYEAFEGILNHSWQGVEYGNKSRQKFMAEALKQNGGPYVVKGFPSLVPATYPLASGSLAKVEVGSFWFEGAAKTNIYIAPGSVTDATNLIQRIVSNNDDFEYGDKITFVSIRQNQASFNYVGSKAQLILKETLSADETDDRAALIESLTADQEGFMLIGTDGTPFTTDTASCIAVGVIHSRGEGSKAKRSDTRMQICNNSYGLFYSDAAYTLALASYQSESGVPVSDDWYLNCFAAGKIGRVVNKAVTYTHNEQQLTANYLALVIEVAGVQKEYVFVTMSNVLVGDDGQAETVGNTETLLTTTIAGLTSATTMAWSADYLKLYSGF